MIVELLRNPNCSSCEASAWVRIVNPKGTDLFLCDRCAVKLTKALMAKIQNQLPGVNL